MHALLIVGAMLLIAACDSGPRYVGVGDVIEVDTATRQVLMRHDEIAGLAEGGTTRFAVPSDEVRAALTPGARVRFELRRAAGGLVIAKASALALGNPGIHDHTPHHGGVVAMAGMIHLEAKAAPDGRIQLYLTDVWRRPLPLANVSGTVTVDLAEERRTLPLGVTADALEAHGPSLAQPTVNAAFALQRDGEPVEVNFLLPLRGDDSGAAGIPAEGCVAPVGGDPTRPRCTLKFGKPVVAVVLDRDAAALLVAQVDFGISAWRLPAARFALGFAPPPAVVVPVVEAPHPEAPNAVVIRSDGGEAVVALENRLIRYAMASGQVVRAFDGPGGIVRAVAYSPDGASLLVSAFYNPSAYLLDAAGGEVRQRFPVEREASAVAFANDGRRVAVGTQAGPVAIFTVGSDAPPRILSGARGAVRTLAFVGDRVVAAGDDGVLRVWDSTSGALALERQLAPTLHAITVNAARALVAASGDERIQLIALADGAVVGTLAGHGAQVLSLAWVASTLVSGDAVGRVALWEVVPDTR